ncbi:MAG TPA: amidohydrolase, partial [Acidobacteria bacterium]|nr:amidohydrolase [Acidobacteriota bacterium]
MRRHRPILFRAGSRPQSALACVCVLALAAAVMVSAAVPTPAQRSAPAPVHAQASARLLITNAMVIYGNGRPPFGPVDVVVESGLITRVGDVTTGSGRIPDAVIDATGKYVMPGIVNTHMHWHEWRVPSIPQPVQYERHLYLAAGVTTVREVGGNFRKSKRWQAESDANTIVSPRILVYPRPNLGPTRSPEEIRAGVRQAKLDGADGLKIGGLDRDQLEALLDEAHRQGLPTAAHIGVEETTAADYVELGVDSIEHFYGIGDAAIDGVQDFPAEMNYSDEAHRFGRAGELFAQADPDALEAVIASMVAGGGAWSPT